MSPPLVTFDSVWKKFRRGERHDSLRDLVPGIARGLFRRNRTGALEDQEFWALQNVSFEVGAGGALGIIGTNGAGKSTALKLLTKILRPTRGVSVVRGRIGALIEIAAGFHPDLTGRENIYLQGTIMGMKQAEIRAKLDDIVAFAGVSEFIDTPVKRYSSGMHARLGFSIASHLDPDVLIIDEVLAVGDMAFQRRCEERMSRFVRDGIALVFVSHNLQAVQKLCSEAILLDRGTVRAQGPAEDVIRAYVGATFPAASSTSGAVAVDQVEIVNSGAAGAAMTLAPGTPVIARLHLVARDAIDSLTFAFSVRRATDQSIVYQVSIPAADLGIEGFQAGERATIEFTMTTHLVRGQYVLSALVKHAPTRRTECEVSPVAFITIDESRSYEGVANLYGSARVVARSAVPLMASS